MLAFLASRTHAEMRDELGSFTTLRNPFFQIRLLRFALGFSTTRLFVARSDFHRLTRFETIDRNGLYREISSLC
jgi:hypothetical protein